MHCAAPVGVELVALLIRLRGDNVKAHVLHVGFQGSLVLGVLPGDLQAVLFSAVYYGNLQVQQASSEAVPNLPRARTCPSAVGLDTSWNNKYCHMRSRQSSSHYKQSLQGKLREGTSDSLPWVEV